MIKEMFHNKKKDEIELGFGNKSHNDSVRFLNKDGSVNIKRKTDKWYGNFDVYHWLITIGWWRFITLVFLSYLVVNTIFAFLYFSIGVDKFGGIKVCCQIDDFLQLFFFSAQTLTTVGYGHIYPNHTVISSIAAIESMMGLLGFALATGVLYGRFSRPKVALEYSNSAVIAPYQNITAFMFRVANRKQNELIENECQLALALNNKETQKREFHFLNLERSKINFLPSSWTIVHPIDDKSPLYNFTEEELLKSNAEFIILFKSINDTYSQTVYSRMSYKANEIEWNKKFTPIKQTPNVNGNIEVVIADVHETMAV